MFNIILECCHMKTNTLQHRCLTVCTEVTGGQWWDPYTERPGSYSVCQSENFHAPARIEGPKSGCVHRNVTQSIYIISYVIWKL